MYCPKCGKHIPENSSFCEHCGENIQMTVSPKIVISKKQLTSLVTLLLVIGIAYYIASINYVFNKKDEKTTTEDVPFQQLTVTDPKLLTGISYLKQSGADGVRSITTEYIYDANGNVLKTNLKKTVLSTNPINEITVKGVESQDMWSADIKQAAQSYYTNWKDDNWSQVAHFSMGIPDTAGPDLKHASESTGYGLVDFTITGDPVLVTSNTYYPSVATAYPSATVPITLVLTTDFVNEANPTKKTFSVNSTVTAVYYATKDFWTFYYPGPLKEKDVNQTKTFPGNSVTDTPGGSVTLEKIFEEPNSNGIFLVFSGKFSDGTAIRNLSFSQTTDNLGNALRDRINLPAETIVYWNGDVNQIKIEKGFTPGSTVARSLSTEITSVSSEGSNDTNQTTVESQDLSTLPLLFSNIPL
jgi:hypothetical protein